METIQIRKKVITDISFNPYSYQIALHNAFPGIAQYEIEDLMHRVGKYYSKMSEFNTNSEDSILKRNIVKQQNICSECEDPTERNYKEVIQSDVIIWGKNRNWPTATDLIVKSFANIKYKFTSLTNPTDLLLDHKSLYQYLQFRKSPANHKIEMASIQPASHTRQDEIQVPINYSLLSELVQIVSDVYAVDLNIKNYHILHRQLKSIGAIDCIKYALHSNKIGITDAINTLLGDTRQEFVHKNTAYNKLLILSEFNLIKSIIQTEYNNSQEYMRLIKQKKINTAMDFYAQIKKKDADKIKALVSERSKLVFAKLCAHSDLASDYMVQYKRAGKWAEERREKILKKLMPMLKFHEDSQQYICEKCGQRVLCKHSLELAGLSHKQKYEKVMQYRNPDDSTRTHSYCKFCNEQIFKNEIDEIMTKIKFDEIARSRQEAMENNSQTSAFENGLYFGVANAMRYLHIGYEFSSKQLIKSIFTIIYNMVQDQINKLNIETDLAYYEQTTQLYSFIYAAIYFMKLFLEDPKVSIPKVAKTQNDYAKYFMTIISQRFGKIVTVENAKKLFFKAYTDLKHILMPQISVLSESDKLLEIMQNPLYIILYKMHLCAHPNVTPVDAFKYIVTQSKPTIINFMSGAKVPQKNISPNLKNIYTFVMDYNSPYCYIFRDDVQPYGAASKLTFDPKIYNELMAADERVARERHIKAYVKTLKGVPNRSFSKQYGANYLYDTTGELKSLDDALKVKTDIDKSTDELIAARNKVLNFKPFDHKPFQLAPYRPIVLPEPPEYIFNKKLLGIVHKLSPKFTAYILEYLGRSEGYDYAELIRGIIPGVESYEIGYIKVRYYCQLFIERYYRLKNNPMSTHNTDILEKHQIDINNVNTLVKELPDINTTKYYELSKKYENIMQPDLYYYWQVESLTTFIIDIEKSGTLAHAFLIEFIKYIISAEKIVSYPNPTRIGGIIITGDVVESEYDEGVDARPANEDKEIDYEQDEDDINDYD